MNIGSNNDQLISDINVTPFVDVMLVLLIIFMVTAPMMIQGIDVSLPEADNKPLKAQQQPLVLTIDKDNQIHINGTKIGLIDLQEKIIRLFENRTDREIYLRADESVRYGILMLAMTEIRHAGIEKIGMVTEPIEEIGDSTTAS